MLGALLLIGSLGLYLTNEQQVTEIYIFSAVMLVQSLPFIAAVVVTLFERSALNDFATWRRLAAALTDLPPAAAARPPAHRGAPGERGCRHPALGIAGIYLPLWAHSL